MVTAYKRKKTTTGLAQTVEHQALTREQEIMAQQDDGRPVMLEERTRKVSSRVDIALWKALKLKSFDTGLSMSEILNRLIQWGIVDGHCPMQGRLSGQGDVHEIYDRVTHPAEPAE